MSYPDDVVETVYGRSSKFEITRSSGMFGEFNFHIYKNGKYFKGAYSSLARAVEVANEAGKR